MNQFKHMFAVLAALVMIALSWQAAAAEASSTVGAAGYDLVSYHNGKKPLPGNGHHVVQHDGVNYLFANQDNADQFKLDPQSYLPAYGGYCAYGVSVGKKFIADPTVWEVVDGKLYLNLDNNVKRIWSKDIAGHIVQADEAWPEIREIPASRL